MKPVITYFYSIIDQMDKYCDFRRLSVAGDRCRSLTSRGRGPPPAQSEVATRSKIEKQRSQKEENNRKHCFDFVLGWLSAYCMSVVVVDHYPPRTAGR